MQNEQNEIEYEPGDPNVLMKMHEELKELRSFRRGATEAINAAYAMLGEYGVQPEA